MVVLDALPLSPSGKLDRDALPAPRAATASSGLTGATERAMGALWQEVLELESPPGADDDFFALGADSFDALALLAGIEARFGRWLGAAAMFESTTLADMVAWLDLERRQQSMSPVIPVRENGSRPPWFFAVADHRAVIAMRNVLPTLMYDQPVYAVHTIDPANPAWRLSSVEAITEKCLSAIRERQPHGPYRLGGYSLGGYVGWELACRLQDAGEQVELLVLLDTFAPYAFSWRGQILIRGREGRGYPLRRRVRGYGGLLRERAQHRLSLLRRPPAPQLYSQDFDERWDHPGRSGSRAATGHAHSRGPSWSTTPTTPPGCPTSRHCGGNATRPVRSKPSGCRAITIRFSRPPRSRPSPDCWPSASSVSTQSASSANATAPCFGGRAVPAEASSIGYAARSFRSPPRTGCVEPSTIQRRRAKRTPVVAQRTAIRPTKPDQTPTIPQCSSSASNATGT